MQDITTSAVLMPHIHLQAIDPAHNIARDYQIETGRDLFGHWMITLHWGRIGTHGRQRTVSFAEQNDASRFVREALSRRANAKSRIGVEYRSASI